MLTKSLHLRQRRPSMLSHPKYRHKEEKRKLLKLSCRKLKKLSDPESVLCKAVLINNTLKYLQQPNTANPSQPPPSPRLLADSETETDLDILNTEIQFPPPLTPLSEENVSTDNEFFNLCYDQLPPSEHHHVLSVEMGAQEIYRDLRNRNDLRSDSDTAATSEEISYQDQSSQVYNISSYSSNNKTNNSSNCSNTASQSVLNLPLHRIVECKV